jgi:hypothetical protein
MKNPKVVVYVYIKKMGEGVWLVLVEKNERKSK